MLPALGQGIDAGITELTISTFMTLQQANSNSWLVYVLALCLTACINIKQSISTSERVHISGTLSREILFDRTTPIWKINLSNESISSIRDSLLRGTAAIEGVYLVAGDSSLSDNYNREYPPFVLAKLHDGAKVSARGELKVGRITSAKNRDDTFKAVICITQGKLNLIPRTL